MTLKQKIKVFLAGYFAATCLISLGSDMMGKEAYIAMCENDWRPAKYTVPAALTGLTVVAYVVSKA